jgi:hypothetical protein
MTTRVRLSRRRGAKLPPGTVVVSRPSRWGNPFDWRDMMGATPELKKEYACSKYEHWLLKGEYGRADERQWILDNIHTIRDAEYVACWCSLSGNCHADILIRLSEVL